MSALGLGLEHSILGSVLGTAVGDSIGLCCEGLSKRRQAGLFPQLKGHNFFFAKGMVSDDTEHTCMVAQSLILSAGNAEAFANCLSDQFRRWLLTVPAGIGSATLRAILRLWLGFSPHQSGVFSAGNGPAMKSAILGVCFGHDRAKLRRLVRVSTRITHTDPRAEYGAMAVALAAHMAARQPKEGTPPGQYYEVTKNTLGSEANEFLELMQKTVGSADSGRTTEHFAAQLGLGRGISGYVYHTVPVVIHSWLTHQSDLRSAVLDVIRCGGDTDTTAAIVGGIVGAHVGKEGIPGEWLDGLWEWPRSVPWMEELCKVLAKALATGKPQCPLPVPLYKVLPRNIFFLLVVLMHGLRRLLPPY